MIFQRFLLLALFLLFPFGQLEKLPLGISGVSIYVHDLVLVGMWAVLLFNCSIVRLFKEDKLVKRFVIFTAITLLSWLVNLPRWGSQSFMGLMYLLRWIELLGIYLIMQKSKIKNQNDNLKLKNEEGGVLFNYSIVQLLRKAIFMAAIFGVIQYVFFPDLRYLRYFGWDDHYYRMTGTFLDPNFFGLVMVLGLGLELWLKGHSERSEESRPEAVKNYASLDSSSRPPVGGLSRNDNRGSSLRIVFYLVCLALTYSRASWLAWLVLLVGWTINRVFVAPVKKDIFFLLRIFLRPLKLLTTCYLLLATVLIFYFVPRPAGEGGNLLRTASIVARQNNWLQTWEVVKKNPFFGVGFNNYQLASPDHAKADNSFLLVWATTGVLGLAAFLWLVTGLKPWWLILPVIFHSLFNNSLFYPWVLILVWGIQGVSDKYEL